MTKVAAANKVKGLGKSPDKLTIKQLKVLIAPLKRNGDGALPTPKAALVSKLAELEERGVLTMEETVAMAEEGLPSSAAAEGEDEDNKSEMEEEDDWHSMLI